MDAATGATIVASVINSSSLNCSSSSSNSSSGYGSSHSTASTPIGSQYETTAHTPISASTEHVTPTATVAPVTPCYSEASLGQQQRQQQQQYYQAYTYPSAAAQYNPIYDAFTGNSYHNLTTPSVERSLSLGSSHNIGNRNAYISNSSTVQQLPEKPHKPITTSTGSHLYSNAASSATTTTSASTKPQATATPFFAQPSSSVSGSSAAYYDTYGKYKMPSSTKLPSHAASDYASYTNHLQHAVASLNYQQQQQHYYATAKSQLQDANYAVKPHRQHSINNASAYYAGSSGTYYDKYEKYMYPPTVGGAAYAAPTHHASHPYSPHEPTTADPYRKVAAAAAANAWHWNMEYASGNCRNLPPTLAAASPTGSARDAFCAASTDKYSKHDKYTAYYGSSHHPQQYMTPPSSSNSSRNLWPNTAHHTPHLASVPPVLNERLTHTLPSAAPQHQYPHSHPHAAHHHFTSAPTAASAAQRQSCCAQPPFQQQSCYYPRPNQQHAHVTTTNPYAPPQQSHYGNGANSSTGTHKYGAYSNSFKSNSSSNDLYVTSPFETAPPAYNYGSTTATALQSRYGSTGTAFYNELSTFDSFPSTAIPQTSMLQQHNVVGHSTHLGYQTHVPSQNPSTNPLLDYRKPTAVSNEYCLNTTRSAISDMEQHVAGTAGFLTFDAHGYPIAQTHPVITSPTIYSDAGNSSGKSMPTTKNIRDFLSTWSEGEEEESVAAASADQLSFIEDASSQLEGRGYMSEMGTDSNRQSASRPKIHVGITVDESLNVDSSQFINLPDIVIDIEKSGNVMPVSAATASVELCERTTHASSPMEPHSPCEGHEMFENFDVEKELDELQIKRAKLCLEKQLNNEIRILTPEPAEKHSQQDQRDEIIKKNEQSTQYQQQYAVHHTECEKSFERPNNFLKDMELNDTTSHSSNSSAFEKEYETFINRIENDKIDAGREQKTQNEFNANAMQAQILNEDSGSVSHQSSGIKTPPDPADIEDLSQKSLKQHNFTGHTELDSATQELLVSNFNDCVQDLSINALESNQKSMNDSMALQNFEGPTHELLVKVTESESFQTAVNSHELIYQASEILNDNHKTDIRAEGSSATKDFALLENDNDKISSQDFSMFYKKKRRFQKLSDSENNQPFFKLAKLDKESSNEARAAVTLERKQLKINSRKLERRKRDKSKRRPLSFFYKNLQHMKFSHSKVSTTILVQQHIALLKERHLPLIKRQSIKNFPTCDRLVYNPHSLKCLTVSIVNTNEFQTRILVDADKKDCSEKVSEESVVAVKDIEVDVALEKIFKTEALDNEREVKAKKDLTPEKDKAEENLGINIVAGFKRAESDFGVLKTNTENELELRSELSKNVVEAESSAEVQIIEKEKETAPRNMWKQSIEKESVTEIKARNSFQADELKEGKDDIIKDALEEQNSTSISENCSTSLKEQEDFSGFEENSKQAMNSLEVSLESSMEVENSKIKKKVTSDENHKIENAQIEFNNAKVMETSNLDKVTISERKADLNANSRLDTDNSATCGTSYKILDSETALKSEPPFFVKTTEALVAKLAPSSTLTSRENSEQLPHLPLMRTKASVKMCDFSDTKFKQKKTRERSKCKSLNSAKLKSKNKRNNKCLETSQTTSDVIQKPAFQGIGKMDKTKFVEKWAASLDTPKIKFHITRTMRVDSTEVLDLSPSSQLPAKTSPFTIDENSNSSTTSSSTSSSNSTCDNASSSSSTSSSQTSSKTSSTSQSSSNESSVEGSVFNELKALERELSQHKTHDEWVKSVAQIVADETGNVIKTDTIKLENFETEATNQDIEDLKKILESKQDIAEVLLPDTETEECAKFCTKYQPDKLKNITEEFIARQAVTLKDNDKLKEEEEAAKAAVAVAEVAVSQKQQNIVPKLSDLCRIALNSSFVISELNVNQNINENKELVKELVEKKPNPPNSPKSHVTDVAGVAEKTALPLQYQEAEKSQATMSVEEELAEMYRQAGVLSDAEDNVNDDFGENHAQDYLLINLAEILANSDNDSNVFLLQCDMNENVLRVMTTSPGDDINNELVIGEVANVDVESNNAVQIVQLVNADSLEQVASETEFETQHVKTALPSLEHNTENSFDTFMDNNFNASSPYVDLPIIHHEEIVPDNYKKFQKEQFFKYLHAKHVQKHVKRFYHANRISKKYRRRYLSKKVSNPLAAAQRSRS